jgi:hypothetical protein
VTGSVAACVLWLRLCHTWCVFCAVTATQTVVVRVDGCCCLLLLPSSLRLSPRPHAHSLVSCVVCVVVCAPSHAPQRASTAAATACVRERVVGGGGGHEHRARRHVTATHWCGCCCYCALSRRVLHRCRCRCCPPRATCASVRVVCVTAVRHCSTCIVPPRLCVCVWVCVCVSATLQVSLLESVTRCCCSRNTFYFT